MSVAPPLREFQRTLNGLWPITARGQTVADGEALCVAARQEQYRRQPQIREMFDPDEALAILLERAVRKARDFDGRGTLSGFLFSRLRSHLFDLWRVQHGRNTPGRGQLEVLSDFALDTHAEGAGAPRLRSVVADPADGWAAAVGGLYAEGDRPDPRADGAAGGAAGGRATGGAAQPASGAGQGVGGGGAGEVGGGPFVDCSGCGWRSYALSPNGVAVWHWPADCAACGSRLA